MKIRRIASMLTALVLLLSMSVYAGAETTVVDSWTAENVYITMNKQTGVLAIQSRETGIYTLTAADGTPLTTDPYLYMDVSETMFEVAVESGLNVFGMIDSQGNLVMPMQYGDTIYLSDRWQLGVVLTEATADNYDYKTFDGKSFYLISGYDVYYQGAMVGTLDRLAYRSAYPYGAYLYVSDTEQNYTYYDSTLTASAYVPSFAGSQEYDETRDGVFHKGSGQQAFTAGCTLTSDDVELDIYLVDGRFVDLQGNVIFAADAKYESISNFKGGYARTRMNGKYGLIDRTGREVMACEYDEISCDTEYFEGGYQVAVKDGKVGYVNKNGEVTCEFKYSKNNVKSAYKMPMTHLVDLDGSIIVLSGAAGELPGRYVEVYFNSRNNCPLFAAEPAEKKTGVYSMYGEEVIPASELFDDVYDFAISQDGSVVTAQGTDRINYIYRIETSAAEAPYESVEMISGTEGGTPAAEETPAEDSSWTCTCGNVNTGKFCSECGTAKPEAAEEVKCAKCGFVPEAGTAPKFCSECGNAF